jgi:hypothetical protein
VKNRNKQVNTFLKDIIGDNQYKGFGDFIEVPYNKKYLHLIGAFKRDKQVCTQMAFRLRQDYPEYYYRIIALFKNKHISLYRNFYSQINDHVSEEQLIKRYFDLTNFTQPNHSDYVGYEIKRELVCFRTPLVKEAFLNLQNSIENNEALVQNIDIHLTDLAILEQSIFEILKNNFAKILKEHLYLRDVNSTKYAARIFGDFQGINDMIIASSETMEIVTNQFDWALVDDSENFKNKIGKILLSKPSTVYIGIIPECDIRGYSLVSMDKLDTLILQQINLPISIGKLIDKVKPLFSLGDTVDLPRFESLIYGRIKYGLLNKTIRGL